MLYTINNRLEPIVFEGLETDLEKRVVQNCKNLIMMRRGEVPYDRMRGLNAELEALPIIEAQMRILKDVDIALGWEPRAHAITASCQYDANGDLLIECLIDVEV